MTRTDPTFFKAMGSIVRSSLAKIGIDLRIQTREPGAAFDAVRDPSSHIGLSVGDSWGPFYPSGSNVFPSDFLSQNIGTHTCCNISLLGATSGELRRWRYSVKSVPTLDDRIAACIPLAFKSQVQCWAAFDQYFTEEVAAWVPLFFGLTALPASSRVRNFSFDLFTVAPALDQIALARP